MSRRRSRGARSGRVWLVVLIVVDIALGMALYAAHGGGPVVLAAVLAVVLGAFGATRRRLRRPHR